MAELAKTHKEAEKKRMEALQQTEKQVAKAARGEIYLNAWHAHQLWTASCRLYPPLPAKLRYLLPCSLIFLPKDSFSHQLFLTLQSCSPYGAQVSGTEQFMKPMGQALDSFLTALALLDTLLPADKLQQNNIIILIEHDLALIHSYMQDIDTGFRLSLVILRNWLRSRTS